MHKLTFRPQAQTDAAELAVFIALDNPKSARSFLKAIKNTCVRISAFPSIGAKKSYKHQVLAEVRMLPVEKFQNYLIFYRAKELEIDIIRIIDARRDLPKLSD